MKKLMIAVAALSMATAANAEFRWCWWVNGPQANDTISGCQLGIADECKEITGAQVGILWNRCKRVQNGATVSFGYTNVGTLQNGCQCSVVNVAREGAALQLGLLNFNPKGFLPFFPFFNFSSKLFGGGRK